MMRTSPFPPLESSELPSLLSKWSSLSLFSLLLLLLLLLAAAVAARKKIALAAKPRVVAMV